MKLDFTRNWLCDPDVTKFLGRDTIIKLEVLAALVDGKTTQRAIAKRHGVTRQCVTKHAANARLILGARGSEKLPG